MPIFIVCIDELIMFSKEDQLEIVQPTVVFVLSIVKDKIAIIQFHLFLTVNKRQI